ncbi:hypothetical protein pdam_00013393 [Pocillopora damicornis]|uniref:Uncharacterized protein n=1 Tax=Pocillopora damicornis TaxID=46731 RepID=A0A3M6TMN9_POCDA|nr:hypothetical protein pdam_00013393 [Pocillopora damicornis]
MTFAKETKSIKLRETHSKQDKKTESTIPSTTAKQSSYRRAQKTTPIVRRRVPQQFTPTETQSKQVCEDEKASREESSAREKSSAAKAEEVTPEVTTAKQSSYKRSQKTTPIVRRRVPRQLPPTETESKQVCKDEKESREKSSAREISSAPKAEEVTPDFECNIAPVHEEKLRMGAKSDFSGNEIGDDFVCYSKSSDEKAMPDVPQWLTEEYKEREEEQENIKLIKGDTTVTSSAQNIRLETESGTKNKMEENVLSEEELDCSSFTESSGYQRKMAELNEKFRRLKAQFSKENRQAVESTNKTMEEIKQSQARVDCIANEIEEMRRRRDEIKEDLKRLDEIGQRRDLEDKKWKEKMDMKNKKLANILEKIRAKRRKYQEETGAENDSTEGHDQQDKNSSESPESEKSKDVTIGNETVIDEDVGNEVLREPHQIIEYKSVKELEEKRKELKQLKRLEKKAIKREKLEQRERKKIEKHKLKKLSAKSSKVSEETAGVAECINQDMEATNTTAKEKSVETPKVTRIKPYVETSSHIAESKQVQAPYYSGLITNGTKNKMEENVFNEEELDCSSFTESSGYQRKMAELDEKSRRLKAQFAKENRQAVESTNKTMEEIKQSQAREDCITNEIEEIQRRRDEIKENLRRLDEKLGETFAEVDRLILGDTDSMVDETVDSQQKVIFEVTEFVMRRII